MSRNLSRSIRLGGHRVSYCVRYSPTARKAKIRVTPVGVEVVLPTHEDEGKAAAFLRDNSSWVLEQLAFIKRMGSLRVKPKPLRSDSIILRGRPTRIEIVEDDSDRTFGIVELNGAGLRVRVPKTGVVDPMKALESWLRRQARHDLETRLAVRGREMHQQTGRIYVMDQRTKWGGCSRRRNLSFNWRLIMAPSEVLDYIVVHELAHLAEPYHSTRFWLIVRSHCPDYEQQKAWLRDNKKKLDLPTKHILA
jgi:predicted metal-dependent hydrolase